MIPSDVQIRQSFDLSVIVKYSYHFLFFLGGGGGGGGGLLVELQSHVKVDFLS